MSVDFQVGPGSPLELAGALARGVLVVLVAYLAAAATVSLGAEALLSAELLARESLAFRIASYVLQAVGFGLGVGLYLAFGDRWDLLKVRVPSLPDLGWFLGGTVVILLVAALLSQVMAQFDVSVAQNQVVAAGQENPTLFLYLIPVSLLFVGPAEELLFRGGVQGLLRDVYAPGPAILLASTLFGGVHLFALLAGGGQLVYVAVAALLGLILGYVYERTDNLVVPALVHGSYNATLFAVQYATVTGLLGS